MEASAQVVGFRPRLLNCGWNVYNVTGQVRLPRPIRPLRDE
jgi:hypothetical protein